MNNMQEILKTITEIDNKISVKYAEIGRIIEEANELVGKMAETGDYPEEGSTSIDRLKENRKDLNLLLEETQAIRNYIVDCVNKSDESLEKILDRIGEGEKLLGEFYKKQSEKVSSKGLFGKWFK